MCDYDTDKKSGLYPYDKDKIRLSGYIAKQNLLKKIPNLSLIIKDENWLEKLPPIPNIRERAYLLLEGLVKKTNNVGEVFQTQYVINSVVSSLEEYSKQYTERTGIPLLEVGKKEYHLCLSLSDLSAISYSEKIEEMNFFLDYLEELNFIKKDGSTFQVTVKGFEKANKLSKGSDSKTAFIAMWFNDSMNEIKNCIEKAVKQTGYNPLRIDNKEHINKIDDEILVEINKSKFLICDLTSEKGKPRGSVYFEAGYAMGKDIPIIWTCNKDLEKELPFDIRQYNCLYWETSKMDDFIKRLKNRIENTVGKSFIKK